MITTNEGRKSWPPGTMYLAGNSSNPMAAIKAGPAKRERRHVRTALTMHAQLHTIANSAKRGEVLEDLGQAVQNAIISARVAASNAPASRIVPSGFLWAFIWFPFFVWLLLELRLRLTDILR